MMIMVEAFECKTNLNFFFFHDINFLKVDVSTELRV